MRALTHMDRLHSSRLGSARCGVWLNAMKCSGSALVHSRPNGHSGRSSVISCEGVSAAGLYSLSSFSDEGEGDDEAAAAAAPPTELLSLPPSRLDSLFVALSLSFFPV